MGFARRLAASVLPVFRFCVYILAKLRMTLCLVGVISGVGFCFHHTVGSWCYRGRLWSDAQKVGSQEVGKVLL